MKRLLVVLMAMAILMMGLTAPASADEWPPPDSWDVDLATYDNHGALICQLDEKVKVRTFVKFTPGTAIENLGLRTRHYYGPTDGTGYLEKEKATLWEFSWVVTPGWHLVHSVTLPKGKPSWEGFANLIVDYDESERNVAYWILFQKRCVD